MQPDEFDLKRALDEPPLPDRGFTRRVMTRVERARRIRRIVFAIALALALAIVAGVTGSAISPGTIVAALILITISSVAWFDGESVAGS